MSSVSEIRDTVLSKRGRYTIIRDNLHAKEVIVGDGERRRRYILCYNPSEARRQKKHREEIVAFLEMELDKHQSRKATARWAIDLLASKRYKRYLTITKSDNIRIDRKKVKEFEKYDGKWVIETNDDTITIEDAACGYKGLMVIERCFRSMKRTQIKMCPMYHWVPRRIEAGGANIAILRRYKYFLAPADHEDYHSHGWYQCQYRKDTSRIEQDK